MENNVDPSDAATQDVENSDPRAKISSNLQSTALSMLESTESFFREVVGVGRPNAQDTTE